MKQVDVEKINRDNFKSLMNALSRPGSIENIEPLFNSSLVAISSVLLYSQVSYFYEGSEDIELIQAMTNAKKVDMKSADYIFADTIDIKLLECAKVGTPKEPEFSATLIFTCKDFNLTQILLSGAGIEREREVSLPINDTFIKVFMEKNSLYPLGNDIFFISKANQVMAFSRTTKIRSL